VIIYAQFNELPDLIKYQQLVVLTASLFGT